QSKNILQKISQKGLQGLDKSL
ncbi:hypothetical protein HMPREF9335_02095, partial [Aggregatibacter aphrophilus F0387]